MNSSSELLFSHFIQDTVSCIWAKKNCMITLLKKTSKAILWCKSEIGAEKK